MLRQSLNLKLTQKLSPQQIQLMKMLQLSTIEFEQKLKEELEENPSLEDDSDFSEKNEASISTDDNLENEEFDEEQRIDTHDIDIDPYLSDDEVPAYKTQVNNNSLDDEEYIVEQTANYSLIEYLTSQLHTFDLSVEEIKIADFLIGNIDDDGYIRRAFTSLVDDYALYQNLFIEPSHLEQILIDYIQKLEPIGIGARDLKECLLIQLKNKLQTKEVALANNILTDYFEIFAKKNYSLIIQKLAITENQLKEAIKEIVKLNPKPGKAYSSSFLDKNNSNSIIPDFTVTIENDDLNISLNNRNTPELKISSAFKEILNTYKDTKIKSTDQKKTIFFVKQKLDSAKGFIEMVKQRQQTLLLFAGAIVNYQKEYFLTGNERDIKPMILKDIAEKTNMAISTISRVSNNKYISTPFGTKLIKDLFSEGLKNVEGETISTKEIKSVLLEIINAEDKKNPLTDDKLLLLLKKRGYNVARRTVAKYREQQNISVARLRKIL